MSSSSGAPLAPLTVERCGAVALVTLDHPPSRNALSEAMLSALQAAIDQASIDKSVRAISINDVASLDKAQEALAR